MRNYDLIKSLTPKELLKEIKEGSITKTHVSEAIYSLFNSSLRIFLKVSSKVDIVLINRYNDHVITLFYYNSYL